MRRCRSPKFMTFMTDLSDREGHGRPEGAGRRWRWRRKGRVEAPGREGTWRPLAAYGGSRRKESARDRVQTPPAILMGIDDCYIYK